MFRGLLCGGSFIVVIAVLALGFASGPRPAGAAPANDNFADAQPIVGTDTARVIGHTDTTGATTEGGEPACSLSGASVWYTWTSPASPADTITFDTFGSNYDTVLAVYTGNSLGSLALVPGGCNDDFNAVQSVVSFTFAPSTTYRIQVSGYQGATGDSVLNLASAADMIVTTTLDNNVRDNQLSLREALMIADGTLSCASLTANELASLVNCDGGDSEMIHFSPFDFPPGTPATINLGSSLPIMGSGNDVLSGLGAGVIIDGQTSAFNCLIILSDNNSVDGLDIRRCFYGIAIEAGSNNTIGTDAGLTFPAPGQRNILRENTHGLSIYESPGNGVFGNYIGTNPAGDAGLGNSSSGIYVSDATSLFIGRAAPAGGNVISGNGTGIEIYRVTFATIQSNHIGTDPAGTAALGNGLGLNVAEGSDNVIKGNLISGNDGHGIDLHSSSFNTVQGNHIGVDAAGTAAIPNNGNGVQITGGGENTIGGAGPGQGNLISGNNLRGVHIDGATEQFTSADVPKAIGDESTVTSAMQIFSAKRAFDVNVTIDITHTFDSDLDIFLVPPSGPAVELTTDNGGSADNFTNTTFDDEALVPITSGAAPYTGSFRPESPLSALDWASRNGTWMLEVTDDAAQDVGTLNSWSLTFADGSNYVEGNLIGTNAAGTAAVLNGAGVRLTTDTQGNTIGGLSAGARNVISGNFDEGVRISGAATTDNLLQGNYIGTNAAGTAAIGNNARGVWITSPRNTIGGTAAGARNVISGNVSTGLLLDTSNAYDNTVQGNYLGVGANGSTIIPNNFAGIQLGFDSANQTIGGTAPGAGNLVAHNANMGIVILGDNNQVRGNTVRNNTQHGIGVSGSGNQIGSLTDVSAANIVTVNGGSGVNVGNGSGNTIGINSIFANAGLGIDLTPSGVTPNDTAPPADSDTGPNGLQNFPVIGSVVTGGGSTTISGVLTSTPSSTFTLQFFHNESCDASGNGEGETNMGSFGVVTDANGTAAFAPSGAFDIPGDRHVTATATDANGNTSEFSACVQPFVDSDRDGVADASDNCPLWPNPSQSLPPWTVPPNDPDCDGTTTAREQTMGTDATKHCNATPTINDEAIDAWPPDANDDQRANLSDLGLLGLSFNKRTPDPAYSRRYDYNDDGWVNLPDLGLFGLYYNKSCAT